MFENRKRQYDRWSTIYMYMNERGKRKDSWPNILFDDEKKKRTEQIIFFNVEKKNGRPNEGFYGKMLEWLHKLFNRHHLYCI
jgi:hypothetical protein